MYIVIAAVVAAIGLYLTTPAPADIPSKPAAAQVSTTVFEDACEDDSSVIAASVTQLLTSLQNSS